MATSALKPLWLQGRRAACRTSLFGKAEKWLATPSTSIQWRGFSDDSEEPKKFTFRRAEGRERRGGANEVDARRDGAPGTPRDDRGRGGGGGRRGRRNQEKLEYGGTKRRHHMPIASDTRHQMINLFFDMKSEKPEEAAPTNDRAALDQAESEEDMEYMAELHAETRRMEAQKERWLKNAQPPVRVPVIDSMGRSYGRGARKSASARVWITPGFGNVTVNRKDIIDYFPRFTDRELLLEPLVVTRTSAKFDLQCQVQGGGLRGQAGAIRLGLARALQHWNPTYRPPMKKMGFLTRDARKVERKKIGKVKARKSPQWNRR